ncbi:carboxypeptidase-like regulatory domain-containing protein [Seonamhaeicola sp. ML3]|uniref:carboxypeptidase-like regulatory domain-containing protein n=1 Tax=Seonamhaeicola sp. ML3 TaxID=2937786 RepID=UPI00200EE8D7|nr:carboxypeptidase-like regulatory domain-containing protein [Seonamhaeicola sp. ML3]
MKTIKLLLFFLLIGSSSLYAQKITGKVTALKKGLSNVKVYLKDTSKETITNKSGFFTIENVTPGNYTIVASSDGYKRVEKKIKVEGNVTIIRLKLEDTEL